MDHNLYAYILTIADNNLILGQRLSDLCGHGPTLETDIACTNIALDLLGQSRSYYQYAAEVEGAGRTEDDLAMLRKEREYLNALLVEQPNADFGMIIMRQYLYDVYHFHLLQGLQSSSDERIKAIADKAIKEVSYHKRFSGDWVIRLGDGTAVSQEKMQNALDTLWRYTKEFFLPNQAEESQKDAGVGPDLHSIEETYYKEVKACMETATLTVPDQVYFQKGGKEGIHSEHMGYLLSDLQYMQRTYPHMEW